MVVVRGKRLLVEFFAEVGLRHGEALVGGVDQHVDLAHLLHKGFHGVVVSQVERAGHDLAGPVGALGLELLEVRRRAARRIHREAGLLR